MTRQGQVADLVFQSEKLDSPLVVAVRIQHRTEEAETRRYGFRFLQPQQLETLLPAEFRRYFNRRRVERFAPDPCRPVSVTLASGRAGTTSGCGGSAVASKATLLSRKSSRKFTT